MHVQLCRRCRQSTLSISEFGADQFRSLREYAESKFKRSGVAVKGNSKITAVGPDWLELEGEGKGTSAAYHYLCPYADSGSALRIAGLVDGSFA